MKLNDAHGVFSTVLICLLVVVMLPILGIRLLVNGKTDGDKILGLIIGAVGLIIWGIVLFG